MLVAMLMVSMLVAMVVVLAVAFVVFIVIGATAGATQPLRTSPRRAHQPVERHLAHLAAYDLHFRSHTHARSNRVAARVRPSVRACTCA